MLLDDRLKCYWVIAMHGNMQELSSQVRKTMQAIEKLQI